MGTNILQSSWYIHLLLLNAEDQVEESEELGCLFLDQVCFPDFRTFFILPFLHMGLAMLLHLYPFHGK